MDILFVFHCFCRFIYFFQNNFNPKFVPVNRSDLNDTTISLIKKDIYVQGRVESTCRLRLSLLPSSTTECNVIGLST